MKDKHESVPSIDSNVEPQVQYRRRFVFGASERVNLKVSELGKKVCID